MLPLTQFRKFPPQSRSRGTLGGIQRGLSRALVAPLKGSKFKPDTTFDPSQVELFHGPKPGESQSRTQVPGINFTA